MSRFLTRLTLAVATALTLTPRVQVQGQTAHTQLVATERSVSTTANQGALDDLRQWDFVVTERVRDGRLKRVSVESDRLVPGRLHERFVQLHRGVRVFGGDVTRQTNQFGQAVSIFGDVYDGLTVDAVPAMTPAAATARLGFASGSRAGVATAVELVVLPIENGAAALTWMGRVASPTDGRIHRIFIDDKTGSVVREYDDTWTQMPQLGHGVPMVGGDPLTLDISTAPNPFVERFLGVDLRRPGGNTTYDLRGNPNRASTLLEGTSSFNDTDIAVDRDNNWNDPIVVAAHAYAGLTYDYYLNEFGRHGLDNHNIRFQVVVNPARPETANTLGGQFSLLFNNAAYYGRGIVGFGVGAATTAGVVTTRNFGGAIDVVAHELSHGVTEFTSGLIYTNESGALNEAFSDMMSTGVEFDNQPLGTGLGFADWLEGEDVTLNGTGLRSFVSPISKGHPDHYSLKFTGTGDNGGVHTNSNIVNHMYYLAVMGGTNRVSGVTVEGVGFANRKLMQKVIYRGFTQLLTSGATFSVARAATIQAARDLFGVGSPIEKAITDAWTAVGVL